MKKTNIRVRRNGGSKSVSPQVPNKPEAAALQTTGPAVAPNWEDKLQRLFLGREDQEDCIWASSEGQLYLWDGASDREPREITFAVAREWWEKFHDPKLPVAIPYFKEATAAARMMSVVCEKYHGPQAAAAAPNFARLFDELESSIDQAQALFILMEREIMTPDGGNWDRDIENGFFELRHQTANRLRAASCKLKDAYKAGAR